MNARRSGGISEPARTLLDRARRPLSFPKLSTGRRVRWLAPVNPLSKGEFGRTLGEQRELCGWLALSGDAQPAEPAPVRGNAPIVVARRSRHPAKEHKQALALMLVNPGNHDDWLHQHAVGLVQEIAAACS